MRNPSKPLRTAYIQALKLTTGLPVFYKLLPAGNTAKEYILLDSMSKSRIVKAKVDYYEWQVRVNVNIYSIRPAGTSNQGHVDDIEEIVRETISTSLPVEGWYNKNTDEVSQQDLSTAGQTTFTDRSLIIFEHWLSERETTT